MMKEHRTMVSPSPLVNHRVLMLFVSLIVFLSSRTFGFTSSSPTSVNYSWKRHNLSDSPGGYQHFRRTQIHSSLKPSQEDSESPAINKPDRKQSSTPLENLNLVAGNPSKHQRVWQQWKRRIPNYLTFLRLIMIPAVVLSFTAPSLSWKQWAPIWFAIATVSDGLDGYLARKWKTCSDFGAFLDPVADKLLVTTTLIQLTAVAPIVAPATIIIVAREVAVSALREWMAQRQLRDTVQVSWQGKLKTACTMVALLGMLVVAPQVLSLPTSADATARLAPSSTANRSLLFGGKAVVKATGAASMASVSSAARTIWRASLGFLYVSTVLTITSGAAYFKAAAGALFGRTDSDRSGE